MENPTISRRILTCSYNFVGTPTPETRKSLMEAGYQFDGKSKQWYRREEVASVTTEEVIAQQLAA